MFDSKSGGEEICSVIFNLCVCLQRITGSTLGRDLKMFGQSLSSGIDVDLNGYQGNSHIHYKHVIIAILLIPAPMKSALKQVELSLSLQMWRWVRFSQTRLLFSGKTAGKTGVQTGSTHVSVQVLFPFTVI